MCDADAHPVNRWGGHGRQFKIMLTLVGLDFAVTTVEKSKTRSGPYFRWRCTCPRQGGTWGGSDTAYTIAEVHAILWHKAEVDRGPWVGPTQH